MLFDIFCSVVDNFGDIGVCWRLARDLHARGQEVRLWVDDLVSFQRLCPPLQIQSARQQLTGIEVLHWTASMDMPLPGDVVIEAFACTLPAPFLLQMQLRLPAPIWFNLEYLSAEDWVDDCHGLASLQGSGLRKYFHFPGFSPQSGGLLCEPGLLLARDAFQASPQAQAQFWRGLGLAPAQADELRVSLFAYENAALPGLLAALSAQVRPVLCLLPLGRLSPAVASWFCRPAIGAGECLQRGSLTVQVIDLLSHEDYDRLLWACDLNFVRGEDSFVRAQWAARPMIWHIYPQDEAAHLAKLEAWLAKVCAGWPAELTATVRAAHLHWNGAIGPAQWTQWLALLPRWRQAMNAWAQQLSELPDLAQSLLLAIDKINSL